MYVFGLLIIVFPLACSGWLFGPDSSPDWNGLRVKWGVNVFSSRVFASQPRTEREAVDAGFSLLSNCTASGKFAGKRYIKDSDPTIILIYDIRGYIAGIQAGIPNDIPNGYPSRNLRPTPFVQDGNKYYVTAYFVNPSTICTSGRTEREFLEFGTGTDLFIQNGSNPILDSVRIPKNEEDIESTLWTRGHCFYTMGRHYWYNISLDVSCDKLFPVFLMYNKGKLNSFGWALKANLPSPIWEHPPKRAYGRFMDPVPTCLYEAGRMSTLHIYLTNMGPMTNRC